MVCVLGQASSARLHEGRIEIIGDRWLGTGGSRFDALGVLYDQRNPDSSFVQGAFFPFERSQIAYDVIGMFFVIVALDQTAVVRSEYDHGVVGQSLGFQNPNDSSDLDIHFLH